jgi:hypothetical protein
MARPNAALQLMSTLVIMMLTTQLLGGKRVALIGEEHSSDDDDDDDDDEVMEEMLLLWLVGQRSPRQWWLKPRVDAWWTEWVRDIPDVYGWKEVFGVTPSTASKLCHLLAPSLTRQDTKCSCTPCAGR